MLFYPIITREKEWSFSPDPVVDWIMSKQVLALKPALPLSVWQEILFEKMENHYWETDREKFKKRINKNLKKYGLLLSLEIKPVDSAFSGTKTDKYKALLGNKTIFELFLAKIENRQLSEDQMNSLAKEMKVSVEEIIILAQQAVHLGYAKWVAAIIKRGARRECLRCGETELESWPGIFGISLTCPTCITMGVFSTQKAVLRWEGLKIKNRISLKNNEDRYKERLFRQGPVLPFELTKAQKQAVQELMDIEKNMKKGKIKETLIWAACGAGKTEVVLEIIGQALADGEKVLYTTPRRDVVHDTARRSQQAFSDLDIQILSGDLPHNFQQAGFVAATTHQVHNYYHAFDLIIVDEMDAFPYHGSKALEYGVKQAMKPGARVIYLTATPTVELRKRVQKRQVFLVRLPARHHGKALPVPELLKCKSLIKNINTVPDQIILELKKLQAFGSVIVFVPVISLVSEIISMLQLSLRDCRIEGSWSSDPKRQSKIHSFLEGKYEFFVSTSIIERGITLSGVQVMVLFADHPLFDDRTLVQMAGRAGRTTDRPDGKVIFAAVSITKAMRGAVSWIEEQNRIAKREGLVE